MRLSDLKTGDEAFIVKVKGHGGFRKRIVEMGFIKGQRVDVLQYPTAESWSKRVRQTRRCGARASFFAASFPPV